MSHTCTSALNPLCSLWCCIALCKVLKWMQSVSWGQNNINTDDLTPLSERITWFNVITIAQTSNVFLYISAWFPLSFWLALWHILLHIVSMKLLQVINTLLKVSQSLHSAVNTKCISGILSPDWSRVGAWNQKMSHCVLQSAGRMLLTKHSVMPVWMQSCLTSILILGGKNVNTTTASLSTAKIAMA